MDSFRDTTVVNQSLFEVAPTTFFEEAPPYTEDRLLKPITAPQNDRYDDSDRVQIEHIQIPIGLHSVLNSQEPAYLMEGWMQHYNPEGSTYYVNAHRRVVTDSPLHLTETSNKVCRAIEQIYTLASSLNMTLKENIEIYVRVDKTREIYYYYMIDHDNRSEFWLEDLDSYDLGFPQVSSVAHLKHVLQEHYWVHREFFPHKPISRQSCEELISILSHARGDQMTSDGSTFPYDATQCANFISLLKNCVEIDLIDNPYLACIIARAWSTVSHFRFENFQGEDHARLSRTQKRLYKEVPKETSFSSIRSRLLFGIPKCFKHELEDLWSDNIVYTKHWRNFAHKLTSNWKEASFMSTGLLVANAAFLAGPQNLIASSMNTASMVCSLGSLMASMILLQSYYQASEWNATAVADHIQKIEDEILGFGPIADAYSLPRGLLAWSTVFLATNALVVAFEMPGKIAKLMAFIVITLIALAMWNMASLLLTGESYTYSTWWGRILSNLRVFLRKRWTQI